jgi:hypothetical protein
MDTSPRDLRLALKANGHSPIPCKGKKPTLDSWQTKLDATDEEISQWSGTNTGILTERTAAFDIDITHEAAAVAVEELAREWLDDRGIILVRFGNAPKRAILFRTPKPFPKFVVHFTDPRTRTAHKIEVLAQGQQLVVDGTHPDTKQPYRWHGDYNPWTVHRDQLPELTESEAQEFAEASAELLELEFGFIPEPGTTTAAPEPLDAAGSLADMRFGGGDRNGIHSTQIRATASLLRNGCTVDDVAETVLEETRRAVAQEPSAASWDWDEERCGVMRMCLDFVAKNPELATALPACLYEPFVAAEGRPVRFLYQRSSDSWRVHAFGRKEDPDTTARPLIVSGADFVADLVPPHYIIEHLIQRGFFYSFTARTGDGKTAVALTLAAHAALGRRIGPHEVEKIKVLYFAGENATDVKMRWLAMAEHVGFDIPTTDVFFVEGAFHFKDIVPRICREIAASGLDFSLILVDTSAAYFDGISENDNTQQGDYARRLRSLTKLPNEPTVLALCHPIKGAADDNLIPRGGGAYLNETDGNLTGLLNDRTTEIHWQGKYRGPQFEPWHFELVEVTAKRLKDHRGRDLFTVIAKHLSEEDHGAQVAEMREGDTDLLLAMFENEGASIGDLATHCGWVTKDGEPKKSSVQRRLARLHKRNLALPGPYGSWELTKRGREHAEKIHKAVRGSSVRQCAS